MKIISRTLSMVAIACLAPVAASAAVVTVESAGTVGQYSSVQINPGTGFASISYSDITNGGVRLATCNDAPCSAPTINTVAGGGGRYTSMSFDGSGNPVVAYATVNSVRIAVCADAACAAVASDNLVAAGLINPAYVSMSLTSTGNPVVSYHSQGTAGFLALAICSDAACAAQIGSSPFTVTTPGPGQGRNASLALSSTDSPVISYAEQISSGPPAVVDLRVAACDSPACGVITVNTVDSGVLSNPSDYTSIALDGSDVPTISYFASTGGSPASLKLARCGDATCSSATVTTVDSGTSAAGSWSSLSLKAGSNAPVISYFGGQNSIKLADCGDATCSSSTITTLDSVVGSSAIATTSLALGAMGEYYVSFYQANAGVAGVNDLRLASGQIVVGPQPADLSITKTNGVASSVAGTSTVYTIVASNAGPGDAAGTAVADTFPAACATVNWTCVGAAGGVCAAASGVGNINDLVNLPSGASVTYSASCAISAAATGTLDNTATVTPDAAVTDPDPLNNTATDSDTLLAQSDMSITLTDAPDPVTAGTNLTYTATATNGGPSDASGVTITVPVPANTSFVSGTVAGGGSCAGAPVVCSVTGNIAPGTSRVATLTFLVAASTANGSVISATATVASVTTDPAAGNNSASTTTSVAAEANLELTLTASAVQALVNEPVTFTATSLNLGPSDAQNLSISMTLTPDFRYSGHTATGATCTTPQVGTTGTIACTWAGATVPNASRMLQVVAFSNNQGATAVNAITTSDTSDPVTANNTGTVSVQVGFAVEEIPTLSQYGLILLGLMLGLIGFVAVRRQG